MSVKTGTYIQIIAMPKSLPHTLQMGANKALQKPK
jgi:hypothetical protein